MATLDFQYQWNNDTVIYAGGYPYEDISKGGGSAHVTSESTGEVDNLYYFTDSNYGFNAMKAAHPDWSDQQVGEYLNNNSSKCYIQVSDKWTVRKGDANKIYVDLTTTIKSAYRSSIIGNPLGGGTATRTLKLLINGEVVYSNSNCNIGQLETYVSSPISRTFTLTLNPETGAQGVSSVRIQNSANTSSTSYPDDIGVGTSFWNLLPNDYRPSAVYNGGLKSCNRGNGARKIYTGSGFTELRTVDGGTGSGNPPSIYGSNLRNQRLVGSE